MKKEIKTKKITLDKLAITMKAGFGSVNKKFDSVTDLIDKLAISTKDGFDRMDKKFNQHDKIFEIMLKEIKTIHEDNKYFRQSISSLDMNDLSSDRKIKDLTVRVEKLELR